MYIFWSPNRNFLFLILFLLIGCNSSSDDKSWELITSSNKKIDISGVWESGCVNDNQNFLEERFVFNKNQFSIYINGYSDSECKNIAFTDEVIVDFSTNGTIEANLLDAKVIANKISGTQLVTSSQEKSSFKQTIYINDEASLFFHHSRFESDGGDVSGDGFPFDLIPIKISYIGEE